MSLRAPLFAFATLALAGCGAQPGGAVSSLNALGLHVHVGDGFVLRSDEGWSVELPDLPAAEREEYGLGPHVVAATHLELRAEGDSRGYVLRVYDTRELPEAEREELRSLAEERVLRTVGHASEPRVTRAASLVVHEVFLSELRGNPEHDALLQTFVLGGFVVEALVIAEQGGGDPSDARRFFASIRLREL